MSIPKLLTDEGEFEKAITNTTQQTVNKVAKATDQTAKQTGQQIGPTVKDVAAQISVDTPASNDQNPNADPLRSEASPLREASQQTSQNFLKDLYGPTQKPTPIESGPTTFLPGHQLPPTEQPGSKSPDDQAQLAEKRKELRFFMEQHGQNFTLEGGINRYKEKVKQEEQMKAQKDQEEEQKKEEEKKMEEVREQKKKKELVAVTRAKTKIERYPGASG